jgi:hypothetical protein
MALKIKTAEQTEIIKESARSISKASLKILSRGHNRWWYWFKRIQRSHPRQDSSGRQGPRSYLRLIKTPVHRHAGRAVTFVEELLGALTDGSLPMVDLLDTAR